MEHPFTLIRKPAVCRAEGEHRRRAGGIRPRRCCFAVALILLFATVAALGAENETNRSAHVKVSGFGLFGNREMVRLLRNFQPNGALPTVIRRTFVEDAALVLFSRANSEGYLNARLQAEFVLTNGNRLETLWTNALAVQLPGTFAAREVRFRMRKGVRFYYKSIEIEGLTAMPKREAKSYFVSGDTLLRFHANRIFNPDLLKSSMIALAEVLRRKGYHDAVVSTNQVHQNEASGAVEALLEVDEGLPSIVRSVVVHVEAPEGYAGSNRWVLHPATPYSQLWEQDLARRLQEQQYELGYPDATVGLSVLQRETNASNIQVDLSARIKTGARVKLDEVVYSGNKRTRLSVLKSRVKLEEGGWLNRVEAEQSRQRLARLGVFESVGLRYEDVDATNRNVIYEFKESKPMSLSVLAGYGSYELLRGGLEFEHRNILGRAHNLRLRGLQSFKSTSGDLQYTVPEMFGENVDAFLKGSGLRREEVSFTRKEYGGSVGIQKYVESIQTDLGAHYDYEFLNALDVSGSTTNVTGLQEARSAAFVIDLNRDLRETPLLPRRGLKLFGKFEIAAAALGGNVDYQRIIVGGSYHLDLHGGRLIHLGVVHGVALTLGGTPEELPFNKRFFPGGENSVRGYQEGEASPLDASGNQLGAETYTQGNFQFEQLLTKSWSAVAFFDAVGFAQDRRNYPWNEGLYSVGGGICWRSIIGPVRLEYGYNLNRRPHDPTGTLHFSIGFPF